MGAGEIGVGGFGGGFCAACFLTAAGGGFAAGSAGGRGVAACALAAGAAAFCSADGFDPVPGSAVMMLTGGIDADEGNSALVGLPVGTDDPSAASGVVCVGRGAGAFHDGA